MCYNIPSYNYTINFEVRKVKKQNKKPLIKTKHRANGGIEVEMTKSPTNTVFGKVVAIAIAALTVLTGLIGLIYLLTLV